MEEKKEKIDFRSPLRIEQERRRNEIVSTFLDYKEAASDGSSDSRIMDAVAKKVGCTTQNVRAILLKQGVYKPKYRKTKLTK